MVAIAWSAVNILSSAGILGSSVVVLRSAAVILGSSAVFIIRAMLWSVVPLVASLKGVECSYSQL